VDQYCQFHLKNFYINGNNSGWHISVEPTLLAMRESAERHRGVRQKYLVEEVQMDEPLVKAPYPEFLKGEVIFGVAGNVEAGNVEAIEEAPEEDINDDDEEIRF
jgi:hypothetical protein